MVGYVLAAVVLLGGAAGSRDPDPFDGASKLNPFVDVAADLDPFDGASKLNPFVDVAAEPAPFDLTSKANPFDPVAKPNPFELGNPKCNPFYGFYQV